MKTRRPGARPLLFALSLLLLQVGAHAQNQCYTPREEQDGVGTAKWSSQRAKMLAVTVGLRAM